MDNVLNAKTIIFDTTSAKNIANFSQILWVRIIVYFELKMNQKLKELILTEKLDRKSEGDFGPIDPKNRHFSVLPVSPIGRRKKRIRYICARSRKAKICPNLFQNMQNQHKYTEIGRF